MAKYRQLFTTIYYSATFHSKMNVHRARGLRLKFISYGTETMLLCLKNVIPSYCSLAFSMKYTSD